MRSLWRGRIGRLEYFTGLLFMFGVFGGGLLLEVIFDGIVGSVVLMLALIVVMVGIVLLRCRRLNDLDYPSVTILATFVPLLGTIMGLWFLFGKGTLGPNQFGVRPPSRIFIFTEWRTYRRNRNVRENAVVLSQIGTKP